MERRKNIGNPAADGQDDTQKGRTDTMAAMIASHAAISQFFHVDEEAGKVNMVLSLVKLKAGLFCSHLKHIKETFSNFNLSLDGINENNKYKCV